MANIDPNTGMPAINGRQVSSIIDRLVLGALMYAAGRGLIDQSLAINLAPVLVGLIWAVWAYWNNRPKAIVQAAAALPDTKVVTAPDLANSTVEKNIVSNATSEVVRK